MTTLRHAVRIARRVDPAAISYALFLATLFLAEADPGALTRVRLISARIARTLNRRPAGGLHR